MIESILWEPWREYCRTNTYSRWKKDLEEKRCDNEEAKEFISRNKQCEEFLKRPDNFGRGAVNQQNTEQE